MFPVLRLRPSIHRCPCLFVSASVTQSLSPILLKFSHCSALLSTLQTTLATNFSYRISGSLYNIRTFALGLLQLLQAIIFTPFISAFYLLHFLYFSFFIFGRSDLPWLSPTRVHISIHFSFFIIFLLNSPSSSVYVYISLLSLVYFNVMFLQGVVFVCS